MREVLRPRNELFWLCWAALRLDTIDYELLSDKKSQQLQSLFNNHLRPPTIILECYLYFLNTHTFSKSCNPNQSDYVMRVKNFGQPVGLPEGLSETLQVALNRVSKYPSLPSVRLWLERRPGYNPVHQRSLCINMSPPQKVWSKESVPCIHLCLQTVHCRIWFDIHFPIY